MDEIIQTVKKKKPREKLISKIMEISSLYLKLLLSGARQSIKKGKDTSLE